MVGMPSQTAEMAAHSCWGELVEKGNHQGLAVKATGIAVVPVVLEVVAPLPRRGWSKNRSV